MGPFRPETTTAHSLIANRTESASLRISGSTIAMAGSVSLKERYMSMKVLTLAVICQLLVNLSVSSAEEASSKNEVGDIFQSLSKSVGCDSRAKRCRFLGTDEHGALCEMYYIRNGNSLSHLKWYFSEPIKPGAALYHTSPGLIKFGDIDEDHDRYSSDGANSSISFSHQLDDKVWHSVSIQLKHWINDRLYSGYLYEEFGKRTRKCVFQLLLNDYSNTELGLDNGFIGEPPKN